MLQQLTMLQQLMSLTVWMTMMGDESFITTGINAAVAPCIGRSSDSCEHTEG